MKPVMTTLVYCLNGAEVLLAKRASDPFRGMWVAPGGKVEAGEAPWECAVRELREETSLCAENLILRGIVLETSSRTDWQWLIMIYAVTRFSGSVMSDEREGTLRWWSRDAVRPPLIPASDAILFPRIIDMSAPVYEARYVYDAALNLSHVHEAPVPDRACAQAARSAP